MATTMEGGAHPESELAPEGFTTSGTVLTKSSMKPPKGVASRLTQPQIEAAHDAELDAKAKVIKAERIQPESIRELKRAENQELVDYLQQLKGQAAIMVAIHRLKPQMFKGKNIKGHIENVEETISEDELRDRYGGGQYQLKIKRRNDQGSWVWLASTTVDIAGDPRTDNLAGNTDNGQQSPSQLAEAGIVQHTLNMMERQAATMRDELRSRNEGTDPKLIEQFMKPFELQIKAMQDEARRKDEQFKAVMDKPSDPFQQKLLEKFVDGDQARVESLRAQYESEIRVIKEGHIQDSKRLEDRFERQVADLRRDYERQLDQQKSGYERELSSVKALHQQMDVASTSSTAIIKSSLDRDLSRLEREIADLKVENKALREKKDKSVMDMVKEVNEFKEVLGVDEGNAEKSTIERVIDTALQSEQLFSAAGKWFGPKPEAAAQQRPAQQQQLQQAPPRFVRNRKTGQIGKWNPATQEYEEVQRRQAGATSSLDDLQIPPEQLQMAITVLERAYANKVPPKNFAATISTGLPPEIFQAIRDHGIDGFVNKVAKLGASSPLRRQDGINWLREVGKVLIGDESPSQPDDDNAELGDDLNDAPDDDDLT